VKRLRLRQRGDKAPLLQRIIKQLAAELEQKV
jgi:hypothetical protein